MRKNRSKHTRREERAVTVKKFRSSGLTQKAFHKPNRKNHADSSRLSPLLEPGADINLCSVPARDRSMPKSSHTGHTLGISRSATT